MPSTAALVKEAIGNTKARRVRRLGGLLRLRVRVRDGERLHRRRDGEARPGHRRGAADAVPGLLGPRHLHPVRRRGRGRGPVRLGRADGDRGHRADDGAPGRVHDLAARRRLARARRPPRRSPAASTRSAWRAGRPTGSRPGPWPPRRSPRSRKAGWTPDGRGPVHPAPGQHPDHRVGGQGPGPARWTGCSSTWTATGTRPPRRCRSRWRRPSTRGAWRSATSSCSSPSGPGSPPGAVALEWTADPARGARRRRGRPARGRRRPPARRLGLRGPDPARPGGDHAPPAARGPGPVRRRARRARAGAPPTARAS